MVLRSRLMKAATLTLLSCLAANAPLVAQESVTARMEAWAKALGVDCAHYHVTDDWANAAKPTYDFARRMSRMVDGLNAGPLLGIAEVTCWTCHRGQSIPARVPRESWQKIQAEHAEEFADQKNRALTMSVYAASLGVECTHCHEAADRAANTKPAKAMVARMLPIFAEIPKYFDAARRPATQCYMCHHGATKPEK